MIVKTSQLRVAANGLLDYIESKGVDEVVIRDDFYWFVSAEERYKPYSEPENLTLGQLEDDWEEVQAIVDKQKEPVGYALVWLATILRRVGETVAC